MHLQRIQVPDFRVLKDVDISFEKEFTPRIFPLGSQNGGGKSTLLQLIFVLLHCAGNPDRLEFIQNLLHGFEVNDESGKRTLAIIDIWDGSKTVKLDFFICSESYILKLLEQDYDDDEIKSVSFYEEKSEKYINLYFIYSFQTAQNFIGRFICQFDGDEIFKLLIELSNKIFLTAHISQIFLFLQPDNRKSLFKKNC